MASWPPAATRWSCPGCPWGGRWPAGWPPAIPRSPASPWSTRWSSALDEESRAGVRALLEAGTEVLDGIGSDIAKEGPVETAYAGTPVAACSRCSTAPAPSAAELGSIRCPTLLMSSREDHVVPTESGDVLEQSVGGPVNGSSSSAATTWPPSTGTPPHRGAGGGLRHRRDGRLRHPHRLMAGPARLTRDEVAHVAALARLELTEEELDLYTVQLAKVLDHAADVSSLDLAGVPLTSHAMAVTNVLRPDEVRPCLDREEVLAQAPSVEDHRFRVPRILGEAP